MACQKSRRSCRRVRPAGAAVGPEPLPPKKEPLSRATSATTNASAASDELDGKTCLATGVPIEIGVVADRRASDSDARRKEAWRKVAELHDRIRRTGFLGDPPPRQRDGDGQRASRRRSHGGDAPSKSEGKSKALLEVARLRERLSRAGLVLTDLPVAVAVPVGPRKDDDAVEAFEAKRSEARHGRRWSMSIERLRASIHPRVARRASTMPTETERTTSSGSIASNGAM